MSGTDDLWNELVAETGEDEVEAAASVSVSEAEGELKAAGFDTNAERAKATATIAALTGGGASASAGAREEPDAAREGQGWVSAPSGPARTARAPSRLVWLVAALIAAATAGGILYGVGRRPKLREETAEPPRPAPAPSAAPAPAPEPTEPAGPPTSEKPPVDWKVPPQNR
jgi:hypothetical protein